MQLSVRASTLRLGMERAAGTAAVVTEVGRERLRISVPVAESRTIREFQQILTAAQWGDDWGSSGVDGIVTVWAEVEEE